MAGRRADFTIADGDKIRAVTSDSKDLAVGEQGGRVRSDARRDAGWLPVVCRNVIDFRVRDSFTGEQATHHDHIAISHSGGGLRGAGSA